MGQMFRSERGNVAVAAAIVLPVMLAAGAAGIDYASGVSVKKGAQGAADAAALAAIIHGERTAEDLFRRNINAEPKLASTLESFDITLDGDIGRVEARFERTNLLAAIGLEDLVVTVTAAAQLGENKPIDVVMALDYSGSMSWDNKFQRMANAAGAFLDAFEGNEDIVRVGIVPFAGETLLPIEGRYLFDTLTGTSLIGNSYLACVSNRGYPHAVNVTTPSDATPASLWPASDFAAFSGGAGGDWASANMGDFGNPPPWNLANALAPGWSNIEVGTVHEYFDVPLGENMLMYIAPSTTYDAATHGPSLWNGPGFYATWPDGTWHFFGAENLATTCTHEGAWQAGMCGEPPTPPEFPGIIDTSVPGSESFVSGDLSVHAAAETLAPECRQYVERRLQTQPLTNDLSSLKTDINAMTPGGLTNISLAFDVGWHVLSENAPWTQSATSGGADKIVVLLTDGVQTVSAAGSGNEFSVSAANRNSAEICEAMKDDGITVYTIAFDVDDSFTKDLLRDCATSISNYFEPDAGANLDDVFEEIAQSLKSPPRLIQ